MFWCGGTWCYAVISPQGHTEVCPRVASFAEGARRAREWIEAQEPMTKDSAGPEEDEAHPANGVSPAELVAGCRAFGRPLRFFSVPVANSLSQTTRPVDTTRIVLQSAAGTNLAKGPVMPRYTLETIIIILLILWLLGGFIVPFGGGLIHLLLVVILIVVIIRLLQGRNAL